MNDTEFENRIISAFPAFKSYWESEDIYREENGAFLNNGLMKSLYHFFNFEYSTVNSNELETLGKELEKIISENPTLDNDRTNAIVVEFYELMVDTSMGKVLEPYRGKLSKKLWRSKS